MLTRTIGLVSTFSFVICLGACLDSPKPKKKSPPKPGAEAEQVEKATEEVAKARSPAASDADVSTPADADPLGSRFRDPDWYSTGIIPHAKVIQNGRTEARDDGTFSSALVFELEDGMTPADCVRHLQGKIDGVSFTAAETGDDGRLTVRGDTEHYRVTLVCGNAKGKPTAYVGYEWNAGT